MTVENDDQVMVVYFEDLAAHERVMPSKDAAALCANGRSHPSLRAVQT
jgi:hypothetical protein